MLLFGSGSMRMRRRYTFHKRSPDFFLRDEMLHGGTIHDKDALTSRLRNLKTSLAELEVKFPGAFDLLDQKIGHFFDIPSPGLTK